MFMKIKNKLIVFIFVIISFLVSCKGSFIFAAIENEIKLKPSSTLGSISNVIKIDNTLYTSNGSVLKKDSFTEGVWTDIGPKFPMYTNYICTGIASDGHHLFASFIGKIENTSPGVYYYDNDSSKWTVVPGTKEANITAVQGDGSVFGTSQSYTFKNGKMKEKSLIIYKITTLGKKQIKSETDSIKHILASGGKYFSTDEGLFDDDGNPVPGAPSSILAIDDSGTYGLTANDLYKLDDFTKYSHKVESPSDMCLVTIAGKKRLLVSSQKGGYKEILLDDTDIAESKTIKAGDENFTTKKPEQYRSSVEKFAISVVFCFEDSGQYYIYLAANDRNYARYTGLWGYYSNKKEWNRE